MESADAIFSSPMGKLHTTTSSKGHNRKLAASLFGVDKYWRISSTSGGFSGTLDNEHRFGKSVAALGDIDGDGVLDMAVGGHGNGGRNRGVAWLLQNNRTGSIKGFTEITSGKSGFEG